MKIDTEYSKPLSNPFGSEELDTMYLDNAV